MALNEILKKAEHLSLPVADDVAAGEPVRVGVLNGWAETAVGEGVGNISDHASINLTGAFKVNITGALTVGQAVYITADRELTPDDTDAVALFGASLTAKSAAAGPAVVAVDKFGPAVA